MTIAVLLLLTHMVSTLGAKEHQNSISLERGLVYLVYAGPYASSPASTFGHLYIAFADSTEHPPALWDVYTFNAETYDAGTFKYVATGVSGGFLGRFEQTKYLSKVQDYVIEDDRDLWVFELSFDNDLITSLKSALSDEEGRWHPYTFFIKNCAFYVQDLLHRVTGSLPPPNGITSPSSVVRSAESAGLIKQSYFRPRMSRSLQTQAENLSGEFQATIRREKWENALGELVDQEALSAYQLRFMLLYFWWAQKEIDSQLSTNVERSLEKLRVRSVDERVSLDSKSDWIGEKAKPGYFHPYSRLGSRVGTQLGRSTYYSLIIRAGAYDHKDAGPTGSDLNQLELFSGNLTLETKTQKVVVDQATIVSLMALVPNNWLNRKRSWSLDLAGQRGGLQGRDIFHSHARYGTGLTKRVVQDLYVFALLELGVNIAVDKNTLGAIGVLSGWLWKPVSSVRFGSTVRHESHMTDIGKYFQSGHLWMNFDLGKSTLLSSHAIITTHHTRFEIGLSRYF